MSSRLRIAVIGIVAATAIFAIAIAIAGSRLEARHHDAAEKARKLDQFCLGTRLSLDTAIQALEGDDVRAREVNARLISEEVFRYGFMSVELCLGAKIPAAPDGWALCQLDKNYACIAKQARAYRDALIKGGF